MEKKLKKTHINVPINILQKKFCICVGMDHDFIIINGKKEQKKLLDHTKIRKGFSYPHFFLFLLLLLFLSSYSWKRKTTTIITTLLSFFFSLSSTNLENFLFINVIFTIESIDQSMEMFLVVVFMPPLFFDDLFFRWNIISDRRCFFKQIEVIKILFFSE